MEHHFNTKIASLYGIEEAVMLHHFYYWIAKNAANEKNFNNGLYWTYNSKKAYAQFFGYLNEAKIFRTIKKLEEKGLVVKGNFSNNKFDKTNWYALTLDGLKLLKENGYDMKPFDGKIQIDTVDCSLSYNGGSESEQPITDNNTDNNTDIEKERDKSLSKNESEELFDECWKAYERKGSKANAKKRWDKLTDKEKRSVLQHIKAYTSAREKQYRKDFEGYLNQKEFNNLVVKGDTIILDPTRETENDYRPETGYGTYWNDERKCYMRIGMYYGYIPDGYTDDNRPDGAKVWLSNYGYFIVWSKQSKTWDRI